VCIIAAGSQGQYESALSKIARGQHQHVKITAGDKVIFSSDPIPGNENEVYSVIEDLSMKGADVVYSDIQDQLHASGHGSQEDLKFLARFTNPKYFMPIGGTIRHQREYEKLMISLGFKKDKMFLLNEGETVWFTKAGASRGEIIETKNIYVDAYGVGDVGNVVLRDRQALSSDGMVVSILVIDNAGNLVTKPRFFSRGFVFEKKEDDLFDEAARIVEKGLKPKKTDRIFELNSFKKEIGRNLEDFFFDQRGRRPLVLVDVIQL
jgi:ribonuclease J